MPIIEIEFKVNAPIERVFDWRGVLTCTKQRCRSIEKKRSRRTIGLINLNESVTWEATHFGVKQKFDFKNNRIRAAASFP
jgi:hypothetical protein